MTPLELVEYIANDFVELSHDKVRVQRDDYIRLAKKVLHDLPDEDNRWEGCSDCGQWSMDCTCSTKRNQICQES